jgi:hypothetical protein
VRLCYHAFFYDEKTATLVWRIYILLTRAEDACRDMKSPLVIRPILHQKGHRSDAHIFVSMLSYHLLTAIEKTLLDQGVHTSWASVRDTLKTHQVCTVVLPTGDGSCLRIREGTRCPTNLSQPRDPPAGRYPEVHMDPVRKIMTKQQTGKQRVNPLMQNDSALKKLEVGLGYR